MPPISESQSKVEQTLRFTTVLSLLISKKIECATLFLSLTKPVIDADENFRSKRSPYWYKVRSSKLIIKSQRSISIFVSLQYSITPTCVLIGCHEIELSVLIESPRYSRDSNRFILLISTRFAPCNFQSISSLDLHCSLSASDSSVSVTLSMQRENSIMKVLANGELQVPQICSSSGLSIQQRFQLIASSTILSLSGGG